MPAQGLGSLGHSPAFFVVRYIILFFFFPLMLPHRAPAESRTDSVSRGQAQRESDAATGNPSRDRGAGLAGDIPQGRGCQGRATANP